MRIVLDTGILVRASAKSTGPAREVLLAIIDGSHELVLSAFLLDEMARVLRYPRLRARHGLSEQEMEEHVDYLRRISELVDLVGGSPVVLTDPDDDPVVYTAVDGRADVLCTRDRHLLQPDVVAFCGGHGISVMDEVDLLRLLSPKPPAP